MEGVEFFKIFWRIKELLLAIFMARAHKILAESIKKFPNKTLWNVTIILSVSLFPLINNVNICRLDMSPSNFIFCLRYKHTINRQSSLLLDYNISCFVGWIVNIKRIKNFISSIRYTHTINQHFCVWYWKINRVLSLLLDYNLSCFVGWIVTSNESKIHFIAIHY